MTWDEARKFAREHHCEIVTQEFVRDFHRYCTDYGKLVRENAELKRKLARRWWRA